MFTGIHLIEAEVHRALQSARIIGMVHVERDVREAKDQFQESLPSYIEDSFIIAWQREGERPNIGTHRAQVNNSGDTMLVLGHYDIPTREDALADMLDRARIHAPAKPGHSLVADEDTSLALWFTPQCIRDHFDGDDDELSAWVEEATEEQLRMVGSNALSADPLYREFHDLLKTEVEWMIAHPNGEEEAESDG
jgi:hypothetical protein